MTIDRADLQMTEAPGQLPLQTDTSEKRLEYHQSGKRGHSLILKPDLGNTVGFTMNNGFATLHCDGLSWSGCWIGVQQFYQVRGRFLLANYNLIDSISSAFWIALWVKSSYTVTTSTKANKSNRFIDNLRPVYATTGYTNDIVLNVFYRFSLVVCVVLISSP